jgi:DNA-binding NarL/FixJ family response regulator
VTAFSEADATGLPAAAAPVRVGVVEDDGAMRRVLAEAIAAAADMELVFAAASRAQALRWLGEGARADVLLVDLGLPDGSGLDVIAAASARWPGCAILVSTVFGDEASVFRSIEAGASGYLLKDVDARQLLREIRTARAGGSPINPLVARKILGRLSGANGANGAREANGASPAAALTAREQEVLRLIGKGFTVVEAARALGLSKYTVMTFVRRIYEKLQVGSRVEALNEARRMGLLANDR